jgi:hypothetical protein
MTTLPMNTRRNEEEVRLFDLFSRNPHRISHLETSSLDLSNVVTPDGIVTDLTVARRSLKNGWGQRHRRISSQRVPLVPAARELLARYVAVRPAGGLRLEARLFLSPSLRGRLSSWQPNRIVPRVFWSARCPGDVCDRHPFEAKDLRSVVYTR